MAIQQVYPLSVTWTAVSYIVVMKRFVTYWIHSDLDLASAYWLYIWYLNHRKGETLSVLQRHHLLDWILQDFHFACQLWDLVAYQDNNLSFVSCLTPNWHRNSIPAGSKLYQMKVFVIWMDDLSCGSDLLGCVWFVAPLPKLKATLRTTSEPEHVVNRPECFINVLHIWLRVALIGSERWSVGLDYSQTCNVTNVCLEECR